MGDEVGRTAANSHHQRGQPQRRCCCITTGCRSKIAGNVPVDEMVHELLSASGGTFTNPATNYYQGERNTLKMTENVAQVFMGMRIQCAQCHNHPFDRWTMDDYYRFAAFFAQIGRKQADDPRETHRLQPRRRRSEAPGQRPA